MVDFPNRREWLARTLRSDFRVAMDRGYSTQLTVRNFQKPWSDVCRWAIANGPPGWQHSPLSWHMRCETHIASGPGVERDLMEQIAKELSSGGNLLLTRASDKDPVYRPFHLPDSIPLGLETAYVVFGEVLGYAILHQSPLPVASATSFVRGVLGRVEIQVTFATEKRDFQELQEMDAQEANTLQWIRNKDRTSEDLYAADLTFSLEETTDIIPGLTRGTTVETKLGRRDVTEKITHQNRNEYVAFRPMRQVDRVSSSSAVRATRKGLTSVVPLEHLSVFSTAEVALMLGGAKEFSVVDMRNSVKWPAGTKTHRNSLFGFSGFWKKRAQMSVLCF